MTDPYLVDKPLGATPLETLALVRVAHPELADSKLSYAGRLDPMATGLLVVLHGRLLLRQERFWGLPKSYEALVMLGMVTDSYDLLGIPTPVISHDGVPTPERMLATIARMVGKRQLPVPPFSSHQVEGRPLFAWAREGQMQDVDIPIRPMGVNEISVHHIGTTTGEELHTRVHARIPMVRGDFRQPEILSAWDEVLTGRHADDFPVIRMTFHCTAGTYIRSLAHALGRSLGTGGTLIDLRRIRVGPWSVDDPHVIHPGQLREEPVV